MEWFREKRIGIFIHYINIMFMLFVMAACYRIKEFSYLYVTLLYAGLMVIYWIYTGLLRRGMQRFVFFVIVLVVATGSVFLFKNKVITYINSDLISNIEGINNLLLDGKATYFYQFKPMITIALPVLVFILFFFYDNRVTEGVLLLGFVEMVFFWYLEYFNEIKDLILPFVILAMITYMINNYRKTLLEFQKKAIYSSIGGAGVIVNIVVVSLIAAILGLTLPQEIKGKNDISILERLEKKYSEGVGSGGFETAKTGIYGLEYSGYTNTEKKLGGPIQMDTALAFKVESDKAYYLKGDIKDEYTGYSWKKSEEVLDKLNEGGNPAIQQSRSSSALSSSGLRGIIFPDSDLREMTIYPEKLKSTSFMVPMYTNKITGFGGDILINEENSTFAAVSKITKSYTIEFYDVDYANLSKDSYTVYYAHNEKYKKYLQLPETVTERTVDLVYDLVKDCKNNTEKVEKLRNYLSKNYTYTLNASILPKDRDFVDYFLFEDPKGYCVHFATALSVMYRIAGIPARYVEGFKMNEASKKGSAYNVTNDTAHAWVEYLVTDEIWAISDCSTTALENNIRIQEEEEKKQENAPTATPTPSSDNPEEEKDKKDTVDGKNNNKQVKGIQALFTGKLLYIEITILAATALGIWFAVLAKRKKNMLEGDSIIPLYKYIIKRLKRYKLQKSESETEREFINSLEEELKIILIPLINKVYEEFYGGINDNSIVKKDIYIKFEEYLSKKEHSFKYHMKKL